MTVTVVLSARGRLALNERVQLVQRAIRVDEVVVASRPDEVLARLGRRSLPYLLDVNKLTTAVALALLVRRRPYVVDTGDDPAALANASSGPLRAAALELAERIVVGNASAVVCRGWFHRPLLRAKTAAPVSWAPDTVSDTLLDSPPLPDGEDRVVASFGSARLPRDGDRAYGWEVVDLVARAPNLSGLLVVSGPGIGALRARAARRGVSHRVTIEGSLPLADLARRIREAGFVTSVQSDDLAGWVRTTGKLPLCLGLGKALVTTRVGEASRVLPDELLVATSGDDDTVIGDMAAVIDRGVPAGWSSRARRAAERFRRSAVAASLGEFLAAI